MYRTFFPRDVFSELNRLQRQLMTFDGSPSSVEIYAFTPGVDPASRTPRHSPA